MLMCVTVDVSATAPARLKLLGEPLRWEIVQLLAHEDLCTCHLVDALGVAQPLVSHHLRVLREAGLVETEPYGSFTYYILDRAVLGAVAGELSALTAVPRGGSRRRPCA